MFKAANVSTNTGIAAVLGISAQSVGEKLKNRELPLEWFEIIATRQSASLDWLFGRTGTADSVINISQEQVTGVFLNRFERIKELSGATSATELGAVLNIKPQSVHSAIKRKKIPMIWLVILAFRADVSLDWLCFGIGGRKILRKQMVDMTLEDRIVALEALNRTLAAKMAEQENANKELKMTIAELMRMLTQHKSENTRIIKKLIRQNDELRKTIAESKEETQKAYRVMIKDIQPPTTLLQETSTFSQEFPAPSPTLPSRTPNKPKK